MSLLGIWLWGMVVAAVVLGGMIGLVRRPVPWRHVNYALAGVVVWPFLLVAVVIAALAIVAGIVREVLWRDEDDFWSAK